MKKHIIYEDEVIVGNLYNKTGGIINVIKLIQVDCDNTNCDILLLNINCT